MSHDIGRRHVTPTGISAKGFFENPLDAVALHRVADLLGHRHAEARLIKPVGADEEYQQPPVALATVAVTKLEVRPTQQSAARAKTLVPSDQTAIRLRPLRRRALSTARPPRVFMRVKKPWVLWRRRLFG